MKKRKHTYKSITNRMFFLFSVVPVIVFCAIVVSVVVTNMYKQKTADTKALLRSTAKEMIYTYERIGNGDFIKLDGVLYAGDVKVSGDYTVIDRLKEYSGADLTLFWGDNRELTTIRDENGKRIVNTKSHTLWMEHVSFSEEFFDRHVDVNGVEYFGYYVPMNDKTGKVVGMGFAGIPTLEYSKLIGGMIRSTVLLSALLSLVVILGVFYFTRYITSLQGSILTYLEEIKEEKYDHTMDAEVLNRKDEYGRMAKILVQTNDALISLIYKDPLTKLFNRRAAVKNLKRYAIRANAEKTPFSFAIGDIDFFKKVNDTYGHNMGDEVLQAVAETLDKDIAPEEFFASRWGGEEFILVFHKTLAETKKEVELVANEIRKLRLISEKYEEVQVTMTFGIAEFVLGEELDVLVSRADKLLYDGKQQGRNRIICQDDTEGA